MSQADPELTPVIAGVGQINDRPDHPGDGLDPVGLMTEALRRAESDAGGDLLSNCDSLAVVAQLAWPQLNPVDGKVAEALGIDPNDGVVRVSMVHYNTEDEVDRLLNGLDEILVKA